MKGISWQDRLHYWFDDLMSKGTVPLLGVLGLLSALIVVLAALAISLVGVGPQGSPPLGFFEAAWASLMHTLDTGNIGTDLGWSFRLVMFVVTLGGVLITSTLIGIVTSGVREKMIELRKGRSRVIESGHTVVLGWAPQILTVLSELVIANALHPRACIVILGAEDKGVMEDAIRDRLGPTGRTRIVCRTGDPIVPADLDIVGLQTARSIIILPSDAKDPDPQTIKTLLAIAQGSQRAEPHHIVASIRDPKNLAVARLASGGQAEVVLVSDLTAHIIARTCVQSGLSVVYTELLNFAGDEVCFCLEPALVGRTIGEALSAYEDSAVIGLCPAKGKPMLNPPMDTAIRDGDQIIAVSENHESVRPSGRTDVTFDIHSIRSGQAFQPTPQRTLVLGWNQYASAVLEHLEHCVAPGSAVTVVADCSQVEIDVARCEANLTNQSASCRQGDTTDRNVLDSLHVDAFQRVILLHYDTLSAQQADARTLTTLLHLRDIAKQTGSHFSLVSEIMDVRNVALVPATRGNDFIVSDELVSLMLAQVSENRALNAVLTHILDPETSEVYLKPASGYVILGKPVNYYTVLESAKRQGQIAFGYRLSAKSNDPACSYGVVLNPDKSRLVTFGAEDRIIVLAKD